MLQPRKKNKIFLNLKSDILKRLTDIRIKLTRKIDKSFGRVNLKGKVKKISSKSKVSDIPIIKRIRSLSRRVLLSILLISLLSFFLIIHLIKFIGISNTNLNSDNNKLDTEEINISFAVYQQKEEYGETFRYISSLSLITIRPLEIKVVNIDPRFEVNGDKVFSVFIKNKDNNQQDNDLVSKTIEDLLRLRVDASILLSYENFGKLMSNFGIINSDEGLIPFKLLDSENKVNFTKQKQEMQLEVIKKYFADSFTFANKYFRYFWQFEDQIKLFTTNLSISNLIIINNSLGAQKRIDTIGLSEESANFIKDDAGNITMLPSEALIKERFFESYKDLRVFAEQAELEVYNASTKPGLASQISGRLGNLGANIIRTGNYFDRIDEATIFLKEESDAIAFRETINAIRRNIDSEIIINIGDYPLQMSGDIVLVLK